MLKLLPVILLMCSCTHGQFSSGTELSNESVLNESEQKSSKKDSTLSNFQFESAFIYEMPDVSPYAKIEVWCNHNGELSSRVHSFLPNDSIDLSRLFELPERYRNMYSLKVLEYVEKDDILVELVGIRLRTITNGVDFRDFYLDATDDHINTSAARKKLRGGR